MKKPPRHSFIVAMALCWCVWITTEVLLPFSEPIPNYINNKQAKTTNEDPAAGSISIILIVANFLEDHNGAITAIATVFIAYFTLALKSVAGNQQKIMAQQTTIIERQHIATHRPKLIIRDPIVMMSPQPQTFIQFEIVNSGGSDARTYRSGVEAYNMPLVPKRSYILIGNKDFLGGETLSPGESMFYLHISPMLRETFDKMEERARFNLPADEIFVLRGVIAYNDDNSTMRKTGFWREYDFVAKRFRPSDDPDHEYSD
jgi:hypothetical protein